MKQKRFTLTLLFVIGLSLAALAQGVITGDKLNIGSGNELNSQYFGGAIGIENSSVGANSLVVGYKDTIPDGYTNSFAAGAHNRIHGMNSFALGGNVKILGNSSIGLGYFLKARNANNFIIGYGFMGNNTNPNKFFENNYPYSLMIGFNSTKPTLTVGPSPNDYPTGDTLGKTGKVAIGDVPVPDIAAKLHIRSDYGENAGIILEPKDLENSSAFILMRDEDHGVAVDEEGVMTITSQDGAQLRPLLIKGKVGINVPDESHLVSSFSLCVNGNILTDKVTIKNYSQWHDYVFDSDYPLMPLSDLKTYISLNRHLPDIPSESEVVDQGVEIGDMQGLLLKKIEELTLYTIQLQEQIESMKKELDELKCKQKM